MHRLGLTVVAFALMSCDKVDYLDVQPSTVVLKQPNNMVELRVTPKRRNGQALSPVVLGWKSLNEAVAKVDGQGRVSPVASGTTDIQVNHGEISARVPVEVVFVERIEVTPPALTLVEGGEGAEVSVRVFGPGGRELKDRSAAYRSLDKSIVAMAQKTALPGHAGESSIEISVDAVKASLKVIVEPEKRGPTLKKSK